MALPAFRILPFDLDAAQHWGTTMGEGQRVDAISSNDGAKIAAAHGPTVATGHGRGFERLGVPWIDRGQGGDPVAGRDATG